MTDKEKFISKVEIYGQLLIERKEHTCGSKKATSQEIRKSKSNKGSIDSFDSIDKNSKNDCLASSLMPHPTLKLISKQRRYLQ